MPERDYNTLKKGARPALLVALALAVLGLLLPGWDGRAAVPAQVTVVTSTSSPTISLTPTVTPTGTLTPGTPTLSPTPTGSLTATATPTPTSGAATGTLPPTATVPFVIPTATSSSAAPVTPTPPPGPTLPPGPTAVTPSRTPTFIPLPSLTFQYPARTPTGVLLVGEAPTDELSKGASFGQAVRGFFRRLGRLTPLLILGALWLGLTVWFVVAQILIHRK